MTNADQPAFPSPGELEAHLGLTKRELFSLALMGHRMSLNDQCGATFEDYIACEANIACQAADALLAELEKKQA